MFKFVHLHKRFILILSFHCHPSLARTTPSQASPLRLRHRSPDDDAPPPPAPRPKGGLRPSPPAPRPVARKPWAIKWSESSRGN